MKHYRLLLVDSDSYTSSLLLEDLSLRGHSDVRAVSDPLELPATLAEDRPEVVIFNYHSDRPHSLQACSTIKSLVPDSTLIAIVSPGPALKAVRTWSREKHCIDVIIEKPLSDERFFMTVKDLLKVKKTSRDLEVKAERLANLVPEGALSAMERNFQNEAELFEAAVLFTDIRGSSQLIREMPPRDFFQLLNQLLSAQSRQIKRHEGSVIKYTGDGVMAVFRGMGRSYLALRCALEIAASNNDRQRLPFGIGVAEGLVLAGLIGDSNQAGQRRQYDVIGATVHLAARLCSMASPGEVIVTKNINAVAKVKTPAPRPIGSVLLRGFESEIDCVAFKPSSPEPGAA